MDRYYRDFVGVDGQISNIAFAGILDKRNLIPGGEFVSLCGNGWKYLEFDSWTYLTGKQRFVGYLMQLEQKKVVYAVMAHWKPVIKIHT